MRCNICTTSCSRWRSGARGHEPGARSWRLAAGSCSMRRLLLVGHGRMGRLVETLAPEYGFDVTGAIARGNTAAPWPDAEVAIDFSAAEAVPITVEKLAPRGTPLVIGTTGWQSRDTEIRDSAARHGIGVV